MKVTYGALSLSHWMAGIAALASWCVLTTSTSILADDQETAKDIVATQIRGQGFACDNAQSAVRDLALSKPDETVWVLKCENSTYRVRLIPGMAARVELLTRP